MYIPKKQLDYLIAKKFNSSFMNDSKWHKLIDRLTDEIPNGIFVTYKLVSEEDLRDTYFIMPEFKPFFIEPTLYRQVEWIEFPATYEDYINPDNRKAGMDTFKQDIALIKNIINEIGLFELDVREGRLRLFAYK